MICDGPNWCLADCMLRNYYQTLSKTAKTGVIKYFVTDRHFINKNCVCQSQNSHIESPSEGGGPRRTDNGMRWS